MVGDGAAATIKVTIKSVDKHPVSAYGKNNTQGRSSNKPEEAKISYVIKVMLLNFLFSLRGISPDRDRTVENIVLSLINRMFEPIAGRLECILFHMF